MSARFAAVGSLLKGIVSGKSVRTLDRAPQEGELGILKVSAVTWGEFRPSESKAMPSGYDPGACPRPMDQDILISRANTRELVGAPVMVRGDHPHLLLSDKILKLIPDEAVVDRRYLVRALRSPAVMKHFFQRAGGSSGSMTNITQADIRDAEIFLPDLPEQRRIAAILDQADVLRAKRREALAQLDRLTQAIFIDMFGDPTTNPKGWDRVQLGELIDTGPQNGLYKPSGAYGSGTPILRVDAFYDGAVTGLASLKRLRVSEKEISTYGLKESDIVINRVNSPVYLGKSALIPALSEPVVFESNMMRFTVDVVRAIPRYIVAFLQSAFIKAQIRTASKDAVNQSSINQQDVSAFLINLPARSVQEEFVKRLGVLDKLQVAYDHSAVELDRTFASLQHRAFRGEL